MYMHVHLFCVCLNISYACVAASRCQKRRGCQILGDAVTDCCEHLMWVLATEFRSPGERQVSLRLEGPVSLILEICQNLYKG